MSVAKNKMERYNKCRIGDAGEVKSQEEDHEKCNS
jgi:hypothetical protein